MSYDYDNYNFSKAIPRMDRQIQDLQATIRRLVDPPTIVDNDTTVISNPPTPVTTSLESLTDVELTSLADKEYIRYNSVTELWENVNMLKPKTQDDNYITTGDGTQLDLSGSSYEELSLQIVSVGTGTGTIILEGSNNGTTYVDIESFTITNAIDEMFPYRSNYQYVRTRCSVYNGLTSIDTYMRASV